jgi:hypothetical protein
MKSTCHRWCSYVDAHRGEGGTSCTFSKDFEKLDHKNAIKHNKTCLGRFQDCGRGKGKNMSIFMAKVEEQK